MFPILWHLWAEASGASSAGLAWDLLDGRVLTGETWAKSDTTREVEEKLWAEGYSLLTESISVGKVGGTVKDWDVTDGPVLTGETWSIAEESRYDERAWDEGYSAVVDGISVLKTQNKPVNLSVVHDMAACPTITFDLTWGLNGNTTDGLVLEAEESGSWVTVDGSIAAGTTSFRAIQGTHSGVSEDTTKFRVRFSTNSLWDTDTATALCPE